jgi:hypothetical protein
MPDQGFDNPAMGKAAAQHQNSHDDPDDSSGRHFFILPS